VGADTRDLKGEEDLENQEQGKLPNDDTKDSDQRKKWEPMRLTFTGDAKDVVQMGGGKLSPPGGDPGESKKQGPAQG